MKRIMFPLITISLVASMLLLSASCRNGEIELSSSPSDIEHNSSPSDIVHHDPGEVIIEQSAVLLERVEIFDLQNYPAISDFPYTNDDGFPEVGNWWSFSHGYVYNDSIYFLVIKETLYAQYGAVAALLRIDALSNEWDVLYEFQYDNDERYNSVGGSFIAYENRLFWTVGSGINVNTIYEYDISERTLVGIREYDGHIEIKTSANCILVKISIDSSIDHFSYYSINLSTGDETEITESVYQGGLD